MAVLESSYLSISAKTVFQGLWSGWAMGKSFENCLIVHGDRKPAIVYLQSKHMKDKTGHDICVPRSH